jgi:hypothetical protein
MLTVDYYHRAVMQARDRDFAAESDHSNLAPAPWNLPTVTTFNARSATTEYGNYTLGTITATDQYGAVTGFDGIPSRPGPDDDGGQHRNFRSPTERHRRRGVRHGRTEPRRSHPRLLLE